MLGTLLSLGLGMGIAEVAVDKTYKNELKEVRKAWELMMYGKGVKNKDEKTFDLLKIIKKRYGYDCIVSLPFGKTFEELENLIPLIKSNMSCVDVRVDQVKGSRCAYMKLITEEFDLTAPFEPVKTKPWEVLVGGTKFYKDIIIDMRNHPHISLTGVTGAGKSIEMTLIALNLIINNTDKDINIYASQISDKQDLKPFKCVKQMKYYAQTLEESVKMYAHLYDEMGRRSKLINQYNDLNNIHEYNKKFPHRKMEYIYVFTDEYSLYMEDESDTAQEDYLKKQCQAYMKKIVKLGRSAGIFLISALQRPDKESMPPIFKANLNVKVVFRQVNGASALTVLDSYEPMKLEDREAIVEYGGRQYTIVTPFCEPFMVNSYAEEYSYEDGNPQYFDMTKYNYLIENSKNHKKESRGKGKSKGKNNKDDGIEVPPSEVKDESIIEFTKDKDKSKGKKGVL